MMNNKEEKIYTKFYIYGNKFTVKDYNENQFGVFHNDTFIGICEQPKQVSAVPVAAKYLNIIK